MMWASELRAQQLKFDAFDQKRALGGTSKRDRACALPLLKRVAYRGAIQDVIKQCGTSKIRKIDSIQIEDKTYVIVEMFKHTRVYSRDGSNLTLEYKISPEVYDQVTLLKTHIKGKTVRKCPPLPEAVVQLGVIIFMRNVPLALDLYGRWWRFDRPTKPTSSSKPFSESEIAVWKTLWENSSTAAETTPDQYTRTKMTFDAAFELGGTGIPGVVKDLFQRDPLQEKPSDDDLADVLTIPSAADTWANVLATISPSAAHTQSRMTVNILRTTIHRCFYPWSATDSQVRKKVNNILFDIDKEGIAGPEETERAIFLHRFILVATHRGPPSDEELTYSGLTIENIKERGEEILRREITAIENDAVTPGLKSQEEIDNYVKKSLKGTLIRAVLDYLALPVKVLVGGRELVDGVTSAITQGSWEGIGEASLAFSLLKLGADPTTDEFVLHVAKIFQRVAPKFLSWTIPANSMLLAAPASFFAAAKIFQHIYHMIEEKKRSNERTCALLVNNLFLSPGYCGNATADDCVLPAHLQAKKETETEEDRLKRAEATRLVNPQTLAEKIDFWIEFGHWPEPYKKIQRGRIRERTGGGGSRHGSHN